MHDADGSPPEDESTEAYQKVPGAMPRDPLGELLAFHKRVRLAFKTLDRLAKLPDKQIDVHEVAALYELFKEDVALHDMDEEASLLPRLRRADHPERLDRLLKACTRQHETLESTLEASLPHLQAVAEGRIPPDAGRLEKTRTDLSNVLEPHLRLEEQEVFPLARLLLTEDELHEIHAEMMRRREGRKGGRARAVEIYESPASHREPPDEG